jgi:hypothetical protein
MASSCWEGMRYREREEGYRGLRRTTKEEEEGAETRAHVLVCMHLVLRRVRVSKHEQPAVFRRSANRVAIGLIGLANMNNLQCFAALYESYVNCWLTFDHGTTSAQITVRSMQRFRKKFEHVPLDGYRICEKFHDVLDSTREG